MHISQLSRSALESAYTFTDNATGGATHIAVEPLMECVKRSGVIPTLCVMADSLIAALERNDLCVEEHHALKLPEAALDTPGLVLIYGDGSHVVADGSHRLWRRWKRGDRDFPAYVIPEAAWRLFVIEGVPGSGAFWDFINRNVQVRP